MSKNREIDFSNFALAFLDVLNQKEILEKIKSLPKNQKEEREEFVSLLKQSLGKLHKFRTALDSFFKAWDKVPVHTKELSKEHQKLFDCIRKSGIKKQLFSDSVIYYTSLSENSTHIPIFDIHKILLGVSSVFISALASRVVFRGGIDIGIASDNFFKKEIYGPALYNAYHLESEIAQYPRIVVGNELFKYIFAESKRNGNDHESNIRQHYAEICVKMICHDADGIKILDYLGEGVLQSIKEENTLLKEIETAMIAANDFVEKELNRFKENVRENRNNKLDQKLAQRYFLLNNYISNRRKLFIKNFSS